MYLNSLMMLKNVHNQIVAKLHNSKLYPFSRQAVSNHFEYGG